MCLTPAACTRRQVSWDSCGVAAERLLADHVLAGLAPRRSSARRGGCSGPSCRRARCASSATSARQSVTCAREAVAARGLGHRRLVAAGDRHELAAQRRWPGHVGERLVGVGVRLAHERVAEHPDADRPDVRRRRASPLVREAAARTFTPPSRTRRRRRPRRARSPCGARTPARPARPIRGPSPSPPTRSTAARRSRSG